MRGPAAIDGPVGRPRAFRIISQHPQSGGRGVNNREDMRVLASALSDQRRHLL